MDFDHSERLVTGSVLIFLSDPQFFETSGGANNVFGSDAMIKACTKLSLTTVIFQPFFSQRQQLFCLGETFVMRVHTFFRVFSGKGFIFIFLSLGRC